MAQDEQLGQWHIRRIIDDDAANALTYTFPTKFTLKAGDQVKVCMRRTPGIHPPIPIAPVFRFMKDSGLP
jgi:hypothetical protein